MAELNKRLRSGWVLIGYEMDSNNNEHFYLMRSKYECEIELKPNGYGYIHTNNKTVRI